MASKHEKKMAKMKKKGGGNKVSATATSSHLYGGYRRNCVYCGGVQV